MEPGKTIWLNNRQLLLKNLLGKGKSGYSWLVESGNELFVLKMIHDEPCPYYTFNESKLKHELDAYKVLKTLDIPVPELLDYDSEKQLLLKAYVDGTVAGNAVAKGRIDSSVFEQLVYAFHKARSAEWNLDYFPLNFVITEQKQLIYVDYEINPFSIEWDLWNWGIYYWLNMCGMKAFLETGDPKYINITADSGCPITTGMESKVSELKAMFEKQDYII